MTTCLREMLALAEARQGSVSEEGLKLYAKMLSRFDIRDVRSAIAEIAEEPREQYESKIPELGELKRRVEEAERKRTHVPFEPCEDCRHGRNGHFSGSVVRRRDDGGTEVGKCRCLVNWQEKRQAALIPDAVIDRARAAGQ